MKKVKEILSFYRDPSADMLYRADELPGDIFNKAKIFHFGSISLINEPVRGATLKAVEIARKNNMIISYDPNLRLPLWPDEATAKKWIIEGLTQADIVKVSKEELEFITGENDLNEGIEKIISYGIKIVFVTLGSEGCYVYNNGTGVLVSGFEVNVQDTTGAGDGFVAGVLYQLVAHDVKNISELGLSELQQMVKFANAVGALATTEKGAISALPKLSQVQKLIRE